MPSLSGVRVRGDQGGLLVNGVLMFGSAWCLVMVQVYFSLMKGIEIGRSRHWLAPHLLRPMTSHFALLPPWSNAYHSLSYLATGEATRKFQFISNNHASLRL